MKTQISTYFSFECQTKLKKIEISQITNFVKKDNFFLSNYLILTECLDKLLMVQFVHSKQV